MKSEKVRRIRTMDGDVDKMEAQLKQWAAQIDGFAARAEKTDAQDRIHYRLSIDDLKVKRVVAQTRFDDFKAAGSGRWEESKAGLELAWCDLEAAFREFKP